MRDDSLSYNQRPMAERDMRTLFISDPDLPEIKQRFKDEADAADTSATDLMVRTLAAHYDQAPPDRAHRRSARELSGSEILALEIPTALWKAIHDDAGHSDPPSKKAVVLRILRAYLDGTKKKRRRVKK